MMREPTRDATMAATRAGAHPPARGRGEGAIHREGASGTGSARPRPQRARWRRGGARPDGARARREGVLLFKPPTAGSGLYVKLVLRAYCVVISFHEERDNDD